MGAKQSEAMREALVWILEKGKSASWAAAKTGITKGAISKNRDYRQFMDDKKEEKKQNEAKN